MHTGESEKQLQGTGKKDNADLQRVTDLLDLHNNLKVGGKQGVEKSLRQARSLVDAVLEDLEDKKGA